ncbi:hypothetical protein KBZ10_17710 [Streptomyces sp. F63]|uniref:hypothetical protein n=1 Tax=Streptomyces sp. F63 TaxID=2824887 RepID=UPI001B37E6A4|nr:hypothetical protein [Streptomyces sp. F63]MBQ0986315.1 hypothetical protein [Streptomyces sp. F63]
MVVPAALRALVHWGARDITLCGNLPRGLLPDLPRAVGDDVRLHYGALGHRAFLDAAGEADVLLASPGLTTLLECSARGIPVVCLPPQNISQILNASSYAQVTGASTADRPEKVFRAQDVLDTRLTAPADNPGNSGGSPGEDAALELIYQGIARAAAAPETVRAELADRVLGCLTEVGDRRKQWTALVRLIGTGGAAQIADAVLSVARSSKLPAKG